MANAYQEKAPIWKWEEESHLMVISKAAEAAEVQKLPDCHMDRGDATNRCHQARPHQHHRLVRRGTSCCCRVMIKEFSLWHVQGKDVATASPPLAAFVFHYTSELGTDEVATGTSRNFDSEVSMQSLSGNRSSLHWSTTNPLTHLQAQVEEEGGKICSQRRSGGRQMDGHTEVESSSLQPGILEGKADKGRGGDEDGRLQRVKEGVKERKEEEDYRVKPCQGSGCI
ncbi:unnamed protein product [Pleuronectes platessa]|uniref:Uncharacterized protein n=1 Tax=Pleuronectes platessa TaxID=8262 RepID=A0A9N7ZB84_PLEPL|nr:unnamed protein product [Pleuronectes platessa]